MLVIPAQQLVSVVLSILWAGVYRGWTLARLGGRGSPLCSRMVTFTVPRSRWENTWPRWPVACASRPLVVVSVLVSAGPVSCTLSRLGGTLALVEVSTVTALSTLLRGRTDVREIRPSLGTLLPTLWSIVPTSSMSVPYALRRKDLWSRLRNYTPGIEQNLVDVLTWITACTVTLARPTRVWPTWEWLKGWLTRPLQMTGIMVMWLSWPHRGLVL